MIEKHEVAVKDITEGCNDNRETGQVVAYNGLLNVRPKYQREFVYKDKQREIVINTVRKGFPRNVMYWVNNSDESYEGLRWSTKNHIRASIRRRRVCYFR